MSDLDQERTNKGSVFPTPAQGSELGINPDGFIWLPVDGADQYELVIRERKSGDLVLRKRVRNHYYVPRQPFPPGEYVWWLRAFDEHGDALGERDPWEFTVPEDALTRVCPTASAVLDDIDNAHPRLVYQADALDDVRHRVRTEQASVLAELESIVEDAYEMGMPSAPEYHLRETEQEQRQYYQEFYQEYRQYIDQNLRACALYHLLASDERAGEFAREMLLHVCGRNPEGPNSVEWLWWDEPGLSHARILPQCYDWTYDLYTEREREYVERTLVEYTRQTYDRLRDDFFRNPSKSHPARLPGYLGEQVILLHERLGEGEAEEMLQYVLDVYNTFYPHWGGDDGGWAEGVPYGQWYNRWYIPFFATLERTTNFSFWDRPFYRRVQDFYVYCSPPNAESMPFGDGQNSNQPASTLKCLLQLWAARYDSEVAAARAAQIDADGHCLSDLMGTIYPPPEGAPDFEALDVPDSKCFSDVGWASLHSDLATPEADNHLLFRSSRYGNVSHSHNNQNAFCLFSGGDALAISTGYRPQHGSPHHEEWTRQTKAHNSILVDGEGQEQGVTSTGQITDFNDAEAYTYLCGDAADAYSSLERFDRHLLYVDPGLYLIYDDLRAPTPSTYSWLLHTHEEPSTDREKQRIEAQRGDAQMRARLFSADELVIAHTDQFEPPVNEGIIDDLREDWPNQHHVTAETGAAKHARILAVIEVWQDDDPGIKCERVGDTIRVTAPGFSGEATVAGETGLTAEVRRGSSTERVNID